MKSNFLPGNKRRVYELLACSGIFVLLAIVYYNEMLFWLPRGIHNWAQSDRYSLALNYYDNGLNFFKPATHNETSEGGLTAPEFPLQSYVAAILGKLFGRSHISILFRLLTLSVSAFAFIGLYQWSRKMGANFFLSLIPSVFLFTSPVYIYYSCNYLPDAASASLILLSYYYIFKFSENSSLRHGLISLVFVGIATLIKMSAGVYFAAISFHGLLLLVKTKPADPRKLMKLVGVGILAAAIIVYYYFHIKAVENTVHSGIFLSSPLPLNTTLSGYISYVKELYETWGSDYHTDIHYALIAVSVIAIILSMVSGKAPAFFLVQWSLNLIAAIVGFYVMGKQFLVHDYYSLAIFLPATVFSIVFLIKLLAELKSVKWQRIISASTIPIVVGMILLGAKKHDARISIHDMDTWAAGIKTPLETYHIGRDEKILITSGDAPNFGLVYADRHGLPMRMDDVFKDPFHLLRKMKAKHLDYLLMEPREAECLKRTDPCFFNYIDFIVQNKEVAIYRFRTTLEDQYWSRIITQDSFVAFTSFEDRYRCFPKSEIARTGEYSTTLNKQVAYSTGFHLMPNELTAQSYDLLVDFWTHCESPGNIALVAQSVLNDTIVDYHLMPINISPGNGDWRQSTATIECPSTKGKANSIEIYLWNYENMKINIDDMKISFKR